MKNYLLLALGLLASVSLASAAVKTGEPAPDFVLHDASGDKVALTDYAGKYVVLEWLNHQCPFVVAHYESGNMQSLQKKYGEQGVVWLSIVSSAPGAGGHDTPEGHTKTAEEMGAAPTEILIDESGEVGKSYGAKTTPHMYVIDPNGILIYQGAIDDSPRGNPSEAKNYVSAALDQSMAGEEVKDATTKPYGCSVKYAK